MCGFCGFTGSFDDNEAVINAMSEKIHHRGPDSSGVHIDDNIALGFRRLAFLDLDHGQQPMFNEDNTLVIVYNGEIYNYQPLREELIQKGHTFTNHSDTEMLIHLFEEEGPNMLNRLRGMFAFAIYDKKTDTLFAARDFFGIKPFYYAQIDGQLLFGSEIKSFLPYPVFKKEVNPVALENYLTFQYSVLEETFFKGVYKLPAAHYLLYKGGELMVKRYWEPKFQPAHLTLEQAIHSIDHAVGDSIEKHRISDVEVGSFLSSGVDSSFVAARFKGAKTFTVGFDYDNYNEIDYAKRLSEKIDIDHFSKTITTEEYWDVLGKVQYHMDEPLADASAVALFFVSQLARGHVKAAMSGEGADEFFGGYNIYKEPLDLKMLTSLPRPLRKLLGKLAAAFPFAVKGKNFFIRGSKSVEERFIGNANVFSMAERSHILKNPTGKFSPQAITRPLYEQVPQYDDITKMQHIDMHLWLIGDILLKADKMSMANSLEVRVPFLDKEVFKVASKLPTPLRVNKTSTKYAFRMAAKGYLPEEWAGKRKLGFPVPIRIWLKEEPYYSKVKAAFESPAAAQYFNTDALTALLEGHRIGKADNSRKIWTVYMFLVWHEQFFGEESAS